MQPGQAGNYWRGNEEEEPSSVPAPQSAKPQTPVPQSDEEADDGQFPLLEPVNWDASEYVHHERDGAWFAAFIAITVLLIAISLFIVQNYFFTILIVVMAIALIVYARRPPRTLHYSLTEQGLNIGQQFHFFNEFRAFGIVEDGALYSVRLLPTARFGQALTVYFAENDGERIVDILGAYLPMEDLKLDLVDVILRRLRL